MCLLVAQCLALDCDRPQGEGWTNLCPAVLILDGGIQVPSQPNDIHFLVLTACKELKLDDFGLRYFAMCRNALGVYAPMYVHMYIHTCTTLIVGMAFLLHQ